MDDNLNFIGYSLFQQGWYSYGKEFAPSEGADSFL